MKLMDILVVRIELEVRHGNVPYKLLSGESRRRLTLGLMDIQVVKDVLAVVK